MKKAIFNGSEPCLDAVAESAPMKSPGRPCSERRLADATRLGRLAALSAAKTTPRRKPTYPVWPWIAAGVFSLSVALGYLWVGS